jgi:hypothetical protein
VDYPRSSAFIVVSKRMSSGSSSMQVLRLAPCSERDPTMNKLMDLRTRPGDGDGSEHLPH